MEFPGGRRDEVAVTSIAEEHHPVVVRGEPAPAWTTGDPVSSPKVPPVVANAMPAQPLEFWTLGEASAAIGRRLGLLRPTEVSRPTALR